MDCLLFAYPLERKDEEMRHGKTIGIITGLLLVTGAVLFSQLRKETNEVTVDEARAMIAKDSTILVLDVRTPEEYTGKLGHIDHAILIPVQELEKRVDELDEYKGKTILAVCRTGRRSGIATELLSKKGFDAKNVEGGMVKWDEKEFPVVREKKQGN